MKSRKHVYGPANEMLIKCWFSVYHNVRGKGRNSLFWGKYCMFYIPREKIWGSESRSLVSCSYLDSIPVLDMPLSLIVFESSPRLTAHGLKSCQKRVDTLQVQKR